MLTKTVALNQRMNAEVSFIIGYVVQSCNGKSNGKWIKLTYDLCAAIAAD